MQRFDDIPDVPTQGGPRVPSVVDRLVTARRLGPSPTRAELQRKRRVAVVLSVAWLSVQFMIFGIRGDIARLPGGYLLGLVAAPLSAGLLAIVAASRVGRFGLGLKSAVIIALALSCPLTYWIAGVWLPVPYAGGIDGGLEAGVYCFASSVAWALLPIVSAGFAFRRAFASGALWRSALLGGGCGLVAVGLFTAHCPVVDKLHIISAHGATVLGSALIGALLLSRFTRM